MQLLQLESGSTKAELHTHLPTLVQYPWLLHVELSQSEKMIGINEKGESVDHIYVYISIASSHSAYKNTWESHNDHECTGCSLLLDQSGLNCMRTSLRHCSIHYCCMWHYHSLQKYINDCINFKKNTLQPSRNPYNPNIREHVGKLYRLAIHWLQFFAGS